MPQLDQTTFFSQLIISFLILIITFIFISTIVLPSIYKALRLREMALIEASFQTNNVCTLYGLTSFTHKNNIDLSTNNLTSINIDFDAEFESIEFLQQYDRLSDIYLENNEHLNTTEFFGSEDFNQIFSIYLNFYSMVTQKICYEYLLELDTVDIFISEYQNIDLNIEDFE